MQPEELIRRAAEIIKKGGWSQGSAARDAMGREIPLFADTVGDNSRGRINPDAVAFSIYGALTCALNEAGGRLANPGAMWLVLHRLAENEHGIPKGGANYVHPIIGYNEDMDRTVEQVLSFLETAALTIESGGDLPPATTEPATLDLGRLQ